MITSLHYKFGIGDEVRLVKRPSNSSSMYNFWTHDDLPTETYKINGWGWTESEDGVFKQYYRLYAYCNKYLNYHNIILEDEIEAVGETHPFDDVDLVFKSVNNDDIKIGMTGYSAIYYGGKDCSYISPAMTFTRYGTIVKIRKFVEDNSTQLNRNNCCRSELNLTISVDLDKTYDNDNKCWTLTQRHSSERDGVFPYLFLTKVDEKFINDYVDAVFKNRDSGILFNEKHDGYNIVKEWLTHMDVYDEVLELAKKRKSGIKKETLLSESKKTKPNKQANKNLEELLANLSESEKESLKGML